MNVSSLLKPLLVHGAYMRHTSTSTNTVPAVITGSGLHHNFNSRHLPDTLLRPMVFIFSPMLFSNSVASRCVSLFCTLLCRI